MYYVRELGLMTKSSDHVIITIISNILKRLIKKQKNLQTNFSSYTPLENSLYISKKLYREGYYDISDYSFYSAHLNWSKVNLPNS